MRRVVPTATVTDVVVRTGGQLSTVYEARCAEPDETLIVKVYADKWRWKLAKEVHIYRLLARLDAGPCPTILLAESTGEHAFTVMTLLPGEPLSAISTQLDGGAIHGIYRQLGMILSTAHRIGQDSYGYLITRILDPQPTNSAYMSRQFAKKLREFAGHGGDSALHRAMQAHITQRHVLFAHRPAPVLCHNDFHEGNVLVAEGPNGWAVTGVIDVENAIAADPLLDLAKTDYYSVNGNKAKLSGLIQGYGSLPRDWSDRVSLYKLYHALELWNWFSALGRAAPLPGIAEDIQRLLTI